MGPPGRKIVAPRGANRDTVAKSRSQQLPNRELTHGGVAIEMQQRMLDVFTRAFGGQAQNPDLKSVMQKVKGHLYDRDFSAAFGNLEYLEAYALRWSAARALAYADIFAQDDRSAWFTSQTGAGEEWSSLAGSTDHEYLQQNASSVSADLQTATVAANANSSAVNIACIGGGAGAEIVALAATLVHKIPCPSMHVLAIDVADWTLPVQHIQKALTTPPPLSPYASQAVKNANMSFVDSSRFSVTFLHTDILDPCPFPLSVSSAVSADVNTENQGLGEPDVSSHGPGLENVSDLFHNIDLVTIMFTLNELFATSLPKTTAFLLRLTDAMKCGTHLVVVDSPGSYSEIRLGRSEEVRKYPMKWLLDHTLLEQAGKDRWKKIEDQDSVWFRLDDRGRKLKYLVDLENCRYQIHVYQRQ